MKSKRFLYLTAVYLEEMPNAGIRKKVFGQLEAIQHHGHHATLLYLKGDELMVVEGGEVVDALPLGKKHRLWHQWNYYNYVDSYLQTKEKYDAFYIRYHIPTPAYLKFLKSYENRGIFTFCEVPTYPYTKEFKGLKGRLYHLLDQQYAQKAGRYYDEVISFYPADRIFGKKPLVINNAIGQSIIERGANLVQQRTEPDAGKSKQLRLFGLAANLEVFHGFDRILMGMRDYYSASSSTQDIHFTIVSQGTEFERLKDLAQEWNILDRLTFLPPTTGNGLDHLLLSNDIGIGTIARCRVGLKTDSSLKSREYCSFGLPLILSAPDRSFPESLPFVHYIPNTEEPVNIDQMINWYSQLTKGTDWRSGLLEYAHSEL